MTDSSGSLAPLLIDIVDDDADLRRALRRLLLANGLSVRTHESAEAFLASSDEPDCLVLDVQLGGVSGPRLYSLLRERAAAPPVVFITARQDIVADLRRSGHVCLQKPFDGQTLVAAISDAFGRRP
jgi:FixJ family two-component response regulator